MISFTPKFTEGMTPEQQLQWAWDILNKMPQGHTVTASGRLKIDGVFKGNAEPEEIEAKRIINLYEAKTLQGNYYRDRRREADKENSFKQVTKVMKLPQQFEVILHNMLKQLIDDSAKGFINVTNWRDSKQTLGRKAQLANIKDLIAIVRSLKDFADTEYFESEQKGEQLDRVMSAENVALMDDARKMLRKAGISFDSKETKATR